ncbi:MAG TPA: BlaI/MecI/CopY family transcriptional regulator [Phycisphaerae bacterium]|nr:BlaI/MecI/CopY family transcriptional regulator [Phycisphaerae bacterium]
MARRASDRPTEAELEILQVLWTAGASSVREVNQALNRRRTTGTTTTLKLMQIMLYKGLLRRDTSTRPQTYEAAVSRQKAQRQFVRDMLDRVFEGSASQLVMQVLSAGRATPEEMDEIRRLLREHGKGTS